MAPTTNSGSGKETAPTVEDLAKRFAVVEDLILPLQHLADTVKALAAQVAEQGQQQRALNLALLRVEHGGEMPDIPPDQVDIPPRGTPMPIDGSAAATPFRLC
jgi:hypothetical protein